MPWGTSGFGSTLRILGFHSRSADRPLCGSFAASTDRGSRLLFCWEWPFPFPFSGLPADGDVKKGGGVFKGARLSREDEWGIASEAIEKAAHAVVEELVKENYTARLSPGDGPMGGGEGKIIKVDGDLAWINMGAVSGVGVGDRFQILSVGEALIDPDTGQVLGIEETETGDGEVVEVKDRYAVIRFSGNAKAKDVVRKP